MRLNRPHLRKNTITALTFVFAACLGQALQADSTIHPVKMDKAQITGGIFQDHEPVVATHNGITTHDVEWTGIWDTQGYTKIYVIYSPGGPIQE